MGKRYKIELSEADKANQSLSSIENAQALIAMGSSYGRPKGAKCRTSKAIRIRKEAIALHEQGLSGAAIAERLGVCRNTVLQALHMQVPSEDDNRQIVAFIRRQLRMMQSVVHDNGGDVTRYADALLLLDRMEQRM